MTLPLPGRVKDVATQQSLDELAKHLPVRQAQYNVLDFGATGDGTTDDTAAIQAAINAAVAAGGGTVYFPEGDYYCGSTTTASVTWCLYVAGDDVGLVGDPGARVFTDQTDAALIFIYGGSKVSGVANWATSEAVDATVYTINAAARNATSVTTSTAANAGNFSIGDWCYIRTGQVIDSSDREPDAEINQVTDTNVATGAITLRWPLVKPYAQEYYVAGTSGITTTAVTANLAPLGIAKITDRLIHNFSVENLTLESVASVLQGGLVEGMYIGRNRLTGTIPQNMGIYTNAVVEKNVCRMIADASFWYVLATATGTSRVTLRDNICSSDDKVATIHIHEGSAQVNVINNVTTSVPSATDHQSISIRARAYGINVIGNRILNSGNTAAIYVDDLCTGGGVIFGNTVDGTLFTAAIAVVPANWYVMANETRTGIYSITDATSDWRPALLSQANTLTAANTFNSTATFNSTVNCGSTTNFPASSSVSSSGVFVAGNKTFLDTAGSVTLGATDGNGHILFAEQGSAPSAPSANQAKLYAEDTGGGKTRLVVRFPTGAVQTIATEP